MSSLRRAAHVGRGWSDYVALSPTEAGFAVGTDVDVVSRCQIDFTSSPRPALVHWTPLDPRAAISAVMKNAEATVVVLPHADLDGLQPATEPLDLGRFWSLVNRLGPSHPLALAALRRRLARVPREAVAFQVRLVEMADALIQARRCSWAQAMAAILRGRETYESVLEGRRDLSSAPDIEASDVTDIAEDVVGSRIDIPGFGDSRTGAASRDSVEPHPRWLSWRALVDRDSQRMEVFYFGERPWGASIRDMLGVVRGAIHADGFSLVGGVETWIPDGLAGVPAPYMVVYQMIRPGPPEVGAYLSNYGLADARPAE